MLVLPEIERRLGIAERLARCIADPRAPERVRHGLAEMIRFRSLLIAAGYLDANDCAALRDVQPSRWRWAGCSRRGQNSALSRPFLGLRICLGRPR